MPNFTSNSQIIVYDAVYPTPATAANGTGALCFSQATGTGAWINVTTGVAVV
jgi:hypothetical protein